MDSSSSSQIISGEAQIHIPEQWTEAADAIAYDSITSPPPICLVCGPPNSGKSTFSRHLLNTLLQRFVRVAYLDTDVGQAEFTPPGCLSLTVLDQQTPDLAIPCLKTPERCFFFGDISSRRDPKIYLTYIHALFDYYHEQYHQKSKGEPLNSIGVPLVVNTPGWVKGIGYDIILDMLKYIAPSHVVKVCMSDESKNLPPGAFWFKEGDTEEVTLFEISSGRQDPMRPTLAQKDARLLRDLRFLAYFRQCLPSDMSILTIQELDSQLAAHPPYEIPMSTIKIKQLHYQVPSTESICSLNATIVGLAYSSEGSEHPPYCLGLGIVRGVDTVKQIVYLITAVPQSKLKDVNLLLQGLIKIPASFYKVQGYVSPTMPTN